MSDNLKWIVRLDNFCDSISNRRLVTYTAILYACVIVVSYIIEGVLS